MRRLFVDSQAPDAAIVREAAGALRRGGIVAYPTDTFYGLAVDPRRDDAVTRLFDLKARHGLSAIALIAADTAQALEVGTFGAAARRLADVFWPGPLTIVVPAAPALSLLLSGERGTLGVRVPDHAVARALAAEFGCPVTATSANLSGSPPALTAADVVVSLQDGLDLVIDGGAAPGGLPSTIVELVEERPVLHRAGAVPWTRVLESLE